MYDTFPTTQEKMCCAGRCSAKGEAAVFDASCRGGGVYLEDLHEDFSSDSSVKHGQVLKRSKHVSQLDHDVGELAVSVLAVNHGLKRLHIGNNEGTGRGVH